MLNDVTLSGIADLGESDAAKLLACLTSDPAATEALRPLMLLRDLPGKERWKSVLGETCSSDGWEALMHAVGKTLWHQSQESTDCRWMRLFCGIMAGRMKFAPTMEELSLPRFNRHLRSS